MKSKLLNLSRVLTKYALCGLLVQSIGFSTLFASEGEAQKFKSVKETYVQVGLESSSLREVIKKIESQTDYKFVYQNKLYRNKKDLKLALPADQTSVADVLMVISEQSGLKFKQINNNIIINSSEEGEMMEIVLADVDISGKVVDENGEGLPGASVLIKGTASGTTTDLEGNYKLSVPENATIAVSYVGYINQEVMLDARTTYDFSMVLDAEQLEEIVVTAFGLEKDKKSMGYAVSEVSSKQIERASTPNISGALYGQTAGVQISQSSGGPTSSTNIIIRGNASITEFNQPLIVVDGIPIAHNTGGFGRWGGGDAGGGINDINPADVETMVVLKGANAAALYGSKAANGVIMITTKKGVKKQGLGIQFSTNYTADRIAFVPDFQNKYGAGYGQQNLAADNDGYFNLTDGVPTLRNAWASFGPEMEGQMIRWYDGEMRPYSPQPNNYRDIFTEGHTGSSTLSISNSSENATFRLAYTNYDHAGIFHNATQTRNVFALNSNIKVSNKVSADIALNYNNIETTNVPPPTGGLNAYEFPRSTKTDLIYKYYQDDQGYRVTGATMPSTAQRNIANTIYGAMNNRNVIDKDRIIGNITLNYDIIEGLNLRLRTGMDLNDTNNENRQKSWNANGNPSGGYSKSESENRISYLESILTYNKSLSEDFDLSFSLGATSTEETFSSSSVGTNGGLIVRDWYSLANSRNTRNGNGGQASERTDAIFAFGQLGYKNMIFLDFTGRNDWSSTLPPESNSYFYPSVSTSFAFSEAFDMPTFITFGKVRVSYAEVGNDAARYKANATYNYGNYNGATTNTFGGGVPPTALVPERQKAFEIGTDMRFFDNRLGIDMTYYTQRSLDLIMGLAVAPSTGAGSVITNIGEMKNSGIEIAINGTPVRTTDFSWDMSFNFAKNKNQVVKLAKGIEQLNLGAWSSPMFKFARPGETFGDWMTYTYLTDDAGNRVVGANGNYIRDDSELVKVGNVTPDWNGGLVNNLRYKNFNMSFLIDITMGGDMFSFTNYYGINAGKVKSSLKYRDEENGGLPYYEDANGNIVGLDSHSASAPNGEIVRHDGLIVDGVKEDGSVNTQIIRASDFYLDNYYWNYGFHEEGLFDNSYIKFRELSFGYTFPKSILDKTFLTGLTLNVIGRNLFFIKKNIPNIDPESSLGTDNARIGFDNSSYPSVRNLGFSLKANF